MVKNFNVEAQGFSVTLLLLFWIGMVTQARAIFPNTSAT